MKERKILLVGGLIAIVVVLYLLFQSNQAKQAAASLASNEPGLEPTSISPASTLSNILSGISQAAPSLSGILANPSGIGDIFGVSDPFGSTDSSSNDAGLESDSYSGEDFSD